jgi:uncharacterized protein (DUF924 family)
MMSTPVEVLDFWVDEVGPPGWYAGGEELDATIRRRFEADWHVAMAGGLGMWLTTPKGALAYLVLTDQMSRNMFRGTAGAYASDRIARAAARQAIEKGWDLRIEGPQRVFFYMPFEHSEFLSDQEHGVRLMKERLPGAAEYLLHARAHREIIRRFGRFPFRNAHLGRRSTQSEQDFLQAGGYPKVVEALKAA